MAEFIDRDDELARLRTLYGTDDAELAVVYGRRQIGKTELVLHSLADRGDVVYHQATQTTASTQLDRFLEDSKTNYPGIADVRQEWDSLLKYLLQQNAIVVLDEFPYLVETNSGLPSLVQHLWDHELADSSGTLVLTGSSIGMMRDHVLGGSAPLYGRLSQTPNGSIELTQLPFDAAMEFVPEYDPETQVFTYGVFGGTPRYLLPVDDSQTLGENITRTLLDPDGPLHDEPETVLQMELDEVNRFFSLLESMASGNRKRNRIAQGAGMESRDTSYYFDRLETLHIIEKHHPVTADPNRSKQTRYRIRDPLFQFWFRYIYGRSGRYELYGPGAYTDLIEPELPDFVSTTFEELCQQSLPVLYSECDFTRVPGNWWYKDREIDVVAPTNESTLVVGECKFTTQPIGYGVLSDLESNAPRVDWTPPSGGEPTFEYVLFSRSGFKRSLEEAAADRDDLRLVDLSAVVAALSSGS
ncbi:ATP-binding protein [Halomontanus rarus]|uniref:ATP-binding protein n=1 Tax=Halomontanus rarus TaxID=3034020 RepID=UPI001A985ED3